MDIVTSEISLSKSIIPIILLVIMLSYNIIFFENNDWLGDYTYHYILVLTSFVATLIGLSEKINIIFVCKKIVSSIKSIGTPIMILLFVGALAGTWKISGIIPAMVYYGLNLVNPLVFLPLTLIVSTLVSLTTGSSYTTSATVGIALIAVGIAFNIPSGMTAGAVISGAYFGDKLSPLSDTTNLAPAMAGTDLYSHIKYMSYTTFPTYAVTLTVFIMLGFNINVNLSAEMIDINNLSNTILKDFYISPLLFLIPALVILLAFLKIKPIIALSFGIIGAIIFSLIFQNNILESIDSSRTVSILLSIFTDTSIPTENPRIERLYDSGGIKAMLWTIFLTISAMIFGGSMDAIGALKKITSFLLSKAKNTFGLFASTAVSCIGINLVASDQYLAIVIPGKMFKDAFEKKNLSAVNLSRTLEDSGTVTSALIPWNTCGAYHYGVLGVSVTEYFIYAIFNWLSPITTLIYAAFSIKIKLLFKNKI